MSPTLTCIRVEEGFDCRLITDGKRVGEWRVGSVEVESEEGKEISTEIETSLRAFMATTDDYFNCSEEDGKLVCKGSLTRKVVEKRGFWERLWGD